MYELGNQRAGNEYPPDSVGSNLGKEVLSANLERAALLGDRAENAGIGSGGVDKEVNITTGSHL